MSSDVPKDNDYTVADRNALRNERRRWFTDHFVGVDKFISMTMKMSDDDRMILKQLVEKYMNKQS